MTIVLALKDKAPFPHPLVHSKSPLLLEVTLLLAVTSPTLPESSMSPRGKLRLMPRLTPTMPMVTTDSDTLDTPDTTVWAMPAMLDTLTLTTTASATATTPTLMPPPPTPSALPGLPPLPSPPLLELTLELDATAPTLLELSTVPKPCWTRLELVFVEDSNKYLTP